FGEKFAEQFPIALDVHDERDLFAWCRRNWRAWRRDRRGRDARVLGKGLNPRQSFVEPAHLVRREGFSGLDDGDHFLPYLGGAGMESAEGRDAFRLVSNVSQQIENGELA